MDKKKYYNKYAAATKDYQPPNAVTLEKPKVLHCNPADGPWHLGFTERQRYQQMETQLRIIGAKITDTIPSEVKPW